jgi:leucyl-tRNA synthetase
MRLAGCCLRIIIEGEGDNRKARLLSDSSPVEIGAIEKMSKSKKNTVDPDDIIGSYGADTARWFVLSDSPPERDVIWTEAGVEGSHKFVQRIWRLIGEAAQGLKAASAVSVIDGEAGAIRKVAHKTLKAVGEDIDRLNFNKAVARLYELVNALYPALTAVAAGTVDGNIAGATKEAANILVQLIAPMMPHLAEECWQVLGNTGMVADTPWPVFDPALIVENTVTMPVQINGKRRGDLTIARDADQATVEVAVLALDFVQAALSGNAPKKIIVVPQRIVNLVV